MKVSHIPFENTGFFSKIISDYLDQKESLQQFYQNSPDFEGFARQIQDKKESYPTTSRKILVDVLQDQYHGINASEATLENIKFLKDQNTFTITTGHQLNLFTGPLYFLYKIISTINLTESLAVKFPEQRFVPVYWMATEDHDFDEINYFNFKDDKLKWNSSNSGAVGQFSLEGLQEVFNSFSKLLGNSSNASYLKELFEKAYLQHSTLSGATRYIANELFKEYGLVIIDADHQKLKNIFSPIMKDELLNQTSFKSVSKTISSLQKAYKIQVNPREINLFYLKNHIRSRIVEENGQYRILDTELIFSKNELLHELENHSERFSPNVIMRPLYEELILPNLCYIGGGGELAYWFQLKSYFESVNVPFPILMLRNSVQIISKKQAKKLDKLGVSNEELFLKQHQLIAKKVKENSEIQFSFQEAKDLLNEQFLALRKIAKETDASFIGAVNAQERKQIKGLENLEKRLLRAEKRKQAELVTRITDLQNQLLPNQSLQERQKNFSEFYEEYGHDLIIALKESLNPLQGAFTILEI